MTTRNRSTADKSGRAPGVGAEQRIGILGHHPFCEGDGEHHGAGETYGNAPQDGLRADGIPLTARPARRSQRDSHADSRVRWLTRYATTP